MDPPSRVRLAQALASRGLDPAVVLGVTAPAPGGRRLRLSGRDARARRRRPRHRTGEAVAIVGQNGSGKSTLVRHLNGLLRPTEGRVLHDGQDVAGERVAALAARVGIVFQNPDRQIFAGKVRDEVAFGPRILGRTAQQAAAAGAAALEAVGLADAVDANPYDLGYSRRKLLTLASVLAMDTPVVVLDEPTTGQDARGIARVQQVVGERRRRAAGRSSPSATTCASWPTRSRGSW